MKDRTWIEIDGTALRQNAERFLKLIPRNTRLMAVVKSNAYGHGLREIAKSLLALRSFSEGGWFGVDSITEALPLRRMGIKNPVLVLGATLTNCIREAAEKNIAITISNFEQIKTLSTLGKHPVFHIKVDTGMHRQGFLPHETFKLLNFLKQSGLRPEGIYTHLATAKSRNPRDRAYTLQQLHTFKTTCQQFQTSGFKHLICHAAATGGALLYPASHLDMVRIGMGLYGYNPTEDRLVLRLKPILTWKTLVSEVKEIPKGSSVGYDGTEQVARATRIAILPIGYWHGYDRRLSSKGQVFIHGKYARVLGRVCMDMIIVDVNGVPNVKVGDTATLLGTSGKKTISADDIARATDISPYEFLTRINPLIRRIVI